MKLKYRGVAYEYKPITVPVIKGEIAGKYRGLPWQQRIPQITLVPEPSVELKYRGVAYRKGAVKLIDVLVEEVKAPITHPEMLSQEQQIPKPEQLKVKQ
jgi:hypothetical protein